MSCEMRLFRAASIGLAALLATGCGSFKKKDSRPTKAEVFQAVMASIAAAAPNDPADDDGDGLPNDVERRYQAVLGTDPALRDSDGDGIDDAFEVFGSSWIYLRSHGQAGALKADEVALGAADPARDHSAELIDSDGDGVPDYLEVAGYDYDWRQARFVLKPDGYHTDPLQWSTDQDAYGDGMEVSRLNMDVAVKEPGNHPLVPAYPDVVIELTGYSIALNEQITDGSGGQLEKGTTWSREVRNEHSSGSEKGFTVGAEYSFGVDGGLTLKAEFSAKWSTTDTHSEAVTSGGSFTEQVNWNQARSYSPVDAARVKLFVRIHNRGTAPASNLVPTINMRVAGANVATFEPELPVYMLLPGAAYPPDPGTAMVIDHDSAGNPLSLTDWELRALQRGGPVTLAVTQKRADVMRLTRDGAWERVGDVNEYLARIVSVSAGVFLDLGTLPDRGDQARLARRLVYAGQGPTAPRVTLAEALSWTDGFAGDTSAGLALAYQRDDGTAVQVPLAGAATNDGHWRVEVDPVTLEATWPHGTMPATAGEVFNLALRPGTQVSLRAPRPQAAALPVIHNAYAVASENGYRVVVCASDYDAIGKVIFVDKFERALELTRDGRGPWFYSANLPNYAFRTPQDPSTLKQEVVKVESLRTTVVGGVATPLTATSTVAVEYTPVAQAPVLRRVSFDSKLRRFYARVEPGGPLALDQVDWVRLYHPSLVDGKTAGYSSLTASIFAFEDPYGWEVTLASYLPGMRLVAHTVGGKFTARDVGDMQDLTAHRSGTVWLNAANDDEKWGYDDEFWSPMAELDEVEPATCGYPVLTNIFGVRYPTMAWLACIAADPRVEVYYVASDGFLSNDPVRNMWNWWRTIPGRVGLPELYVRADGVDTTAFSLGFHIGGTSVSELGGRTSADYYANVLGYPELLNLQQNFSRGYPQGGGSVEAYLSLQRDMIIAFETSDGRLGKARVSDVIEIPDLVDSFYSHSAIAQLEYVIYPRSEDVQAPGGLSYGTPNAVYAVGKLIEPANEAALATGAPPEAFRLCAAMGTPCLSERPDLLPVGMTFNTRTGAIAGAPRVPMGLTEFLVYAWNYGGETNTRITIEVLMPPPAFSYPASSSCLTGYPCVEIIPTLAGTGTIDRFDVAPALPAGLLLGVGDGIVRGTPAPAEVTAPADYVVTASNRAGSRSTAILRLGTPLGAPQDIRYAGAPYVFDVNTLVNPPRAPTALGGPAAWTVSPALPAGLLLDPDTGAIYGTPTAVTAAATYRVTATNAAPGSAFVDISIQVR